MITSETLGSFRVILEAVERMFPGSHPVIGGGALRDSYHNRPIKDVDVFIRAADFKDLTHPLTSLLIPAFISEYAGRPDLHGVWDVIVPIEGYEVQLILADFDDHVGLAHTFDLGLSRITYNGVGLHMADDFVEDSLKKQFRICRHDNDNEVLRSQRRIARLLKKYPEFSVVAL